MSGTSELVRRSSASSPLAKLSRMLQSMSRKWPRTSLIVTTDGFGASRIDGSSLHIVRNGQWTDADMRDLLALFATWLVADPDRLRPTRIPLDGVLLTDRLESAQSNGPLGSRSAQSNSAITDQSGPDAQPFATGEYSASAPASVPTEYGS